MCWGVALEWPLGILGAWLGAACFAASIRGELRSDLLGGGIAGMLCSAVWFRELPEVWNTYSTGGGHAFVVALVVVQALPFALVSAIVGKVPPSSRPLALGLALATQAGAVRWLPVPLDLSWLGTSWTPSLWPVALAGTPAFGLLLGLFGGVANRRPPIAALSLVAWVVIGLGWHALPLPPPDLPVSLVQPDIDPFEARRSSTRNQRAERVADLVTKAQALTLLPETTWPHDPEQSGADVVGHVGPGPSNRLSTTLGAFDKRELLPIAETPFLGIGNVHFVPGSQPRRLDAGTAMFAPLICFEDLVPGALWEVPLDGGGPLLLATNDSWLGRAGEKHLRASILAAVRTGRWAARPATTGPSATIDPRGRIRARTPAVAWPSGPGQVLESAVGTQAPVLCGVLFEPFLSLGALLGLLSLVRRT